MLGPAIKSIIENDARITQIVGANFFPISDWFDPQDEQLPAIYYSVQCLPQHIKNGTSMQDWRLTLITMNTRYEQSWELSMLLKQIFEARNLQTVGDIKFQKLFCTSMVDDYEFQVRSYGQRIEFEIRTQTLKQ